MQLFTELLDWIACGSLRCFYQLFEPSFWWYSITTEDPLVSKWCNNKFLHLFHWRNKLIYILNGLRVSSIFSKCFCVCVCVCVCVNYSLKLGESVDPSRSKKTVNMLLWFAGGGHIYRLVPWLHAKPKQPAAGWRCFTEEINALKRLECSDHPLLLPSYCGALFFVASHP